MPSRAAARNLAALIIANGGGLEKDRAAVQARWDAVPQARKDKLERFLDAHRTNPIGLIYK